MDNAVLALLLQQGPAGLTQFLPFLLILVIFYLVLFLPMQRRQKKQRQMLEALKNGDQVTTSSGLVGTIVGLNNEDQTIVLRVKPDNVKLQMARSAVSSVVAEEKK